MRLIENYSPPTPQDLRQLKESLGKTGEEMAQIAGLTGNSQWRKYTGGESPRKMNMQMLFYIAAQLVLEKEQLNDVIKKMSDINSKLLT